MSWRACPRAVVALLLVAAACERYPTVPRSATEARTNGSRYLLEEKHQALFPRPVNQTSLFPWTAAVSHHDSPRNATPGTTWSIDLELEIDLGLYLPEMGRFERIVAAVYGERRYDQHGNYRSGTASFRHIHHLFLPRAALALAALWRKSEAVSDRRMKNMLLFYLFYLK